MNNSTVTHTSKPNSMLIKNRLAEVRQALKGQNNTSINHANNNTPLSAVIVPTADPHLSEYLPEHWQLREWLSGFTGSAGTLVVTNDYAGLWADSRYWVQAEVELAGTGIELQKLTKTNTHIQWLANTLPAGSSVEINGNMLSIAEQKRLNNAFDDKDICLITTDSDVVSQVYQHRPALPNQSLFRHAPEFVSQSAIDKLTQVRHAMHQQGASHHLLSSLDDIAWLTNLRGSDVAYNPVFLSHMLISQETAILFIEQSKVADDIRQELSEFGIELADYQQVHQALSKLGDKETLLIDPNKVAVGTLMAVEDKQVTLIESVAPSTLLKSRKSSQDIEHIKEAMRQDGVALCGCFAEFEQRLASGETLTELDVDAMLIEYRSQQPHYVSPSFPTIAGFNANGALPHYRATEDSFSQIEGDGLLLIDSGAQYHNGTTDITRVLPIGNISEAHKYDFTAVLKAHIALASAHFPEGIASPSIDAICRAPLWALQLDYGHGTGHGVGYFLNVHEGPQGISYSAPATAERAMRAGMVTSNEPALYRDGQWGIRIENLVATVATSSDNTVNQYQANHPIETKFGDYLHFETVTYCPIDTRLINKSMLTAEEITWLNDYHAQVYDELSHRLQDDEQKMALEWLTERTQPI